MKISKEMITKGFVLAGFMNISGVLILTRFFTNPVIPEFDAQVMSNFGLLMIVIWGIVFISVAKSFDKVKWLVGAFMIEKIIYAVVWTNWMLNNNLSAVFEKDKMAGVFYSIYGINDWMFFIFFLLVFIQLILGKENK